MASSVTLGAYNVLAGGRQNYQSTQLRPDRLPQLQTAIRALDADVIGLSDTHRWAEMSALAKLEDLFGYPYNRAIDGQCQFTDPRIGVTLLSRLPGSIEPLSLGSRYGLKAWLQLPNGWQCRVYCAYFIHDRETERLRQAEAILKDASTHAGIPTCILGDLNCLRPEDVPRLMRLLTRRSVQWAASRSTPTRIVAELAQAQVIPLLRSEGFSDGLASTPAPITHQVGLGRLPWKVGLRLDHILTRNWPLRQPATHWLGPASDHAGITALATL